MFEISFANRVAAHIPNLRRNLRIAHLQYTPTAYVSKLIKTSLMYSFLFTVLFFFIIKKAGMPIVVLLPIFAALLVAIFLFLLVDVSKVFSIRTVCSFYHCVIRLAFFYAVYHIKT